MREMTIKEAAQALGVCTQTVRRRINSGEYTARKEVTEMGERWLITANQIKAAIKNTEVMTVTRQVTVPELQELLQHSINNMVQEAVRKGVDAGIADIKEELHEVKEQLAATQSILDGHYRLVDERLRQITEQKQEQKKSFLSRLFS